MGKRERGELEGRFWVRLCNTCIRLWQGSVMRFELVMHGTYEVSRSTHLLEPHPRTGPQGYTSTLMPLGFTNIPQRSLLQKHDSKSVLAEPRRLFLRFQRF